MSPTFVQKINQLLFENKLEEAIVSLSDGNEWIPDIAQKELSAASELVRQLKQQEIRGVISNDEILKEKEKIKITLQNFVEKHAGIDSDKEDNLFKNNWLLISLLIMFLVALLYGISKYGDKIG